MKQSMGFTLTEILAVIVILAAISLVAVPIVDNALKEGRAQLYQTQIKNIEQGLRNWGANNPFNMPDKNKEISLTLSQLQQLGYIESNVRNPNTKGPFPSNMLLTIKNTDGIFSYNVLTNTGTQGEYYETDKYAPVLIMNGKPITEVEINEVYKEEGVIAQRSDGTMINTASVSTVISGNTGTINTSSTDNKYEISYSITDNNITTTIIRNVHITDKTPPVLKVPDNAIVKVNNVRTFNLLEGVLANDNSSYLPTITITGQISAIPGKYLIAYTASDKTGNTITARRLITVVE